MTERNKGLPAGLAWVRPLLDLAMLVLFIIIMHPRYTGMGNHARLAYALCTLVVAHLLLNWRFFAAWGGGPWTKRRVLLAVLDVLLLGCLAAAMVSVKLIPKHTGFNQTGLPQGYMSVHIIAGWLSMFLLAIHLGLHGNLLASVLPERGWLRKLLVLVWNLAALAGFAGAVHIRLVERAQALVPLLKTAPLDPWSYYTSVVLVVILIGTITHYIVKRI
jgi:hypothetical protein